MPNQNNFCFTLNNYTNDDDNNVQNYDKSELKYFLIGKEKGETGTPHYQGFISFKERKSKQYVIDYFTKLFGHNRTHIELCKGTAQQNVDYCSKGEKFIEYGTIPAPAAKANESNKKRSYDFIQLCKKDEIEKIENDYPDMLLRYHKTYNIIKSSSRPIPSHLDDVTGCLLWGPTETGKSETAYSYNPYKYKLGNAKQAPYDNQEVFFIDELHIEQVRHYWKEIMEITDRYVFEMDIKFGDIIKVRPKKVIFTSNDNLDELASQVPYPQREAFKRRFKEVIEHKKRIIEN